MVFKTGMKILICIPRTSVDAEDMLMRAASIFAPPANAA